MKSHKKTEKFVKALKSIVEVLQPQPSSIPYSPRATCFILTTCCQYVSEDVISNGGSKVLADLASRNVTNLSFYDLVLDFTFLDALEDLADPPRYVFLIHHAVHGIPYEELLLFTLENILLLHLLVISCSPSSTAC